MLHTVLNCHLRCPISHAKISNLNLAAYDWYKQRGQDNVMLDPSVDNRYTFINGRLVIDSPSSERADDGRYQCAATNLYGTILSNQVELAFGCKSQFIKS